MPAQRSLDELLDFVRTRTLPVTIPLVPELRLYQATELTPLWHATATELDGWDPAPFWAFAWAGGQAVARHVLDNPELVRGRRVLDFAAGGGIVAIAAARAGAARVVAADLDPFCEAALLMNCELNDVEVAFRAGDALEDDLGAYDVVLVGDVFYEDALARRCANRFAELASDGVLVLVGDPGRSYSPRTGFSELASYQVRTSIEIEQAELLHARVLRALPSST